MQNAVSKAIGLSKGLFLVSAMIAIARLPNAVIREGRSQNVVRVAQSVPSSQPSPQPSRIQPNGAEMEYFLEIALGAEFTSAGSKAPKIRKWQGDVRVQVKGTPTEVDSATVYQVIQELNELTQGKISLKLSDKNPNIIIHFAPMNQFTAIEPNWEPGNYGYFWDEWDENGILNHANVLVTFEKVTQTERCHLIREELTQSLGLMQDSNRYPDSMFYQPWSHPTQYSPIDKALIRMLYDDRVKAGMSREQVKEVFKGGQKSFN